MLVGWYSRRIDPLLLLWLLAVVHSTVCSGGIGRHSILLGLLHLLDLLVQLWLHLLWLLLLLLLLGIHLMLLLRHLLLLLLWLHLHLLLGLHHHAWILLLLHRNHPVIHPWLLLLLYGRVQHINQNQ